MKRIRKTVIQRNVFKETEEIYQYIKLDSVKNAQKFKQEVIKSINEIEANPQSFPPKNF